MTTWAQFSGAEPEFAARVRGAFERRKHATMATLRADGAPRISGTEVQFDDDAGQLVIGSMSGARKGADLLRDGRVALHSPTIDPPADDPSAWQGEAKISGRAIYDSSETEFDKFEIDIDQVVFTDIGQSKDKLRIASWNRGQGLRVVERS